MCLNQESTKSHKMDTNSIPRIVIYIIRKVYERSLEGLGFRNFKKKTSYRINPNTKIFHLHKPSNTQSTILPLKNRHQSLITLFDRSEIKMTVRFDFHGHQIRKLSLQ